jgi:hypothetical protein
MAATPNLARADAGDEKVAVGRGEEAGFTEHLHDANLES